jgi:hypothetical protein
MDLSYLASFAEAKVFARCLVIYYWRQQSEGLDLVDVAALDFHFDVYIASFFKVHFLAGSCCFVSAPYFGRLHADAVDL